MKIQFSTEKKPNYFVNCVSRTANVLTRCFKLYTLNNEYLITDVSVGSWLQVPDFYGHCISQYKF